ncbi:MAG: glycosyltransferase family 2 protein [Solirubrobacteraceae bacterium]
MARIAAVAPHTDRRHVVGRLRGLSVILPCHDEAQNVERAIAEATAAGELVADAHEILVVDDGSTDATRELAQACAAADPRVRVLVHDGNRGYGAAVRTGIAAARLEWIFLTDADLQFDMTELARFVPLAQSSDIVAGFRTRRADPPHRLLNAAAWNALVRRVFDVPLRDVDCAFKLMRRDLVQALPLAAEGAMVSTELVTRAHDAGARIAELGVGHRPRMAGRSSGASPRVVLRAFRELRAVRAQLREGTPAGAPADLSPALPAGAPADLSRPRAA